MIQDILSVMRAGLLTGSSKGGSGRYVPDRGVVLHRRSTARSGFIRTSLI